MGQAESKESEQNSGQTPQHVRRNTVHGTERTRRPTPPITNPVSQRPTETKRSSATPGAPVVLRAANTPQTFPRSRGLANVRPRMAPPAASQCSSAATARTSGKLKQQIAIRPTKAAEASSSSPVLPTPLRSQPIPISQPSTRSRPERPVQSRGRPTARRSAPPTKTAAQATESDLEPAGPPAKRVTRSRAALTAVDKTVAAPLTTTPVASSSTAAAATAGPSGTKKQPRAARKSDDEPTRIGDIESESAHTDKMSISTDSDASSSDVSDSESDDPTSHSSDDSEDPNKLDQDLELDGSDDGGDDESEASGEKSDGSNEAATGLAVSDVSRRPARQPVGPRAPAEAQFQLRRSRRRSVPVRHLQVNPHLVSYVSV